jgi:hypothetical protein
MNFAKKRTFFAKTKLRAIVRTSNLPFSCSLNERKTAKIFPTPGDEPGPAR